MAVAKRQRKEKPAKMEQKKIQGPGVRTSVKQTALLASPIYIGQAQGKEEKTYKKRSQNWASLLFTSFGLAHPSFEDVFSFACQVKLSCNTDLSVDSNFCCGETELKKLQTPPTVVRCDGEELYFRNPRRLLRVRTPTSGPWHRILG